MDLLGSQVVPLLTGITAVVFAWLWLSARNKNSRTPLNETRRSLAFRISNIPQEVMDKDKFQNILTKLPVTPGGTVSKPKSTLLGFSYSPSAAPSHAERYAVATATFANGPTVSELDKLIKREIGVKASRLTVDLDFFGLTPLTNSSEEITVDIIAVTGLAGHAFGSWKSKNKPDMWLRDFLPETIPNARILTYGYDTKLPGSQSEASIPDLSRRLLESIKTIRSGDTKKWPLILIGHSLGGLVVKEALAQAFEGSEDDNAVFISCFAILLFGVPNRGLDHKNLMSMVKGQPNEDLVNDLKQSSRFLNMLGQRFNKYFTLDDSKIICIYETRTVQWSSTTASWEKIGSEVMMVPFTSAIHAGPNEKVHDQIPIEADHSEIVKFGDPSSPDYLIIESRIRQLVDKAPKVIQERLAKIRKKLSESEKLYIDALKAPDYAFFRNSKVSEPTPGTLNWFLENELVRQWLTNSQPSALWVQGSPGQGKTILAKFLLAYLEASKCNHRTAVIYFFFYDQDDNCQTVCAALRSLIKQLLSVPDAFQIISNKFNLETSSISDESIWAILEELLCSSLFDTIYCVIDALDECQDLETRQRFLALIEKLVQPPLTRKGKPVAFKAFLTSRPTVDLSRNLKQFPSIQLKASPDDLKIFISSKIQNIRLPAELEQRAIALLSSRVEQTFLWISTILKKLKTMTTMLSEADIEQMISESPSDLTDLYESIVSQIMQSNDKATQKLLIWTVFGRRALGLHELEDALAIQETSNSIESLKKYKIHDLTESTITSAAGIILELVDGKVYLIHQSAKDFLLKTEHVANATFCRGLQPSIYLAKVCMTYLCFTDFIEAIPCRDSVQLAEKIRRHPFLHYAARNWHRHIKINDKFNDFDIIIGRLTKPGSPELLVWAEVAGIANLDTAENAWDIATMANIPWLAEFQSRGSIITEDMIEKAISHSYTGYNFMKSLTAKPSFHLTEGAIYAAVKYFDHETIRQLLDKDANIAITPALFEAAASNQKYGRHMTDLLLEFQDSLLITEELVRLAADNNLSGREIIELLLHNDNTNISEDAVAEIAANFDIEIIRTLVNLREDIKLTNKVTKAVMSKRGDCKEMMIALMNQKEVFLVTEEFIQIIAEYFDVKAMKLIFEKQGQQFWITEEVIKAAAKNWRNKNEVMAFLFDRRADFITITEKTMSIIAESFNGELMTLLFNRRGDEITITENIIKAAVRNNVNVVEILLDRREDEITITENIMKAAVGNNTNMVELFLDRRGDEITITENIMKAAIGNNVNVVELLLNRRGDEITITENIMEAAVRNNVNVVEILLDRREDEITITENIMKAAVGNNTNMVELFLDRRGDEITITENIMKAAIGNNVNVVELLLNRRGDEITITENIMKAAVGSNINVVELFLDRRGDEITITENIMKAAVRNNVNVVEILLDRRGDEVIITEEIIKRAAGGPYSTMKFLLNRRGDEISITEGIMKTAAESFEGDVRVGILLNRQGNEIIITESILISAANNYHCGPNLMQLLLDQRGDEIIITEGVVEAAAAIFDKRGMQLLLDRRGDEIIISEKVVKAAARRSDQQTMALLLDQRGDEIIITKGVIEAAAASYDNKVMKLLLDRRGDEIIISEEVVKVAASNPLDRVMAFLLDQRGDETIITEDVIKAAAANRYTGVMKLLLDQRGDTIIITEGVIKAAATAGNIDLLSDRVNVAFDLSNWHKISEFYIAACVGDSCCLEQLLCEGIDPDMKNMHGETPLYQAAYRGHVEAVQVLVQRANVDVNSISVEGRTPLFWPSSKGNEQIVAILLEYGADPYITDNDGQSAVTLARQNGYDDIAQMLAREKKS